MAPAATGGQGAVLLQQALALFRARQWAQAERCCRQLLALAPGHAEAQHLLGVISLDAGQPAAAAGHIARAIELAGAPTSFMYLNQAIALERMGQAAPARASLRRAVALQADNVDAWVRLGLLELAAGDPAAAAEASAEAVTLDAGKATAWACLGAARLQQGRAAEAEDSLRRALALVPASSELLSNLATALIMQERRDEAVACLRQALAQEPGSLVLRNNLAQSLLVQERTEEAIALLRAALALNPLLDPAPATGRAAPTAEDLNAALTSLGRLGNACLRQGGLDEALACYRQALALCPDNPALFSSMLMALQYLPGLSPDELLREHQRYARQFELPLRPTWASHGNSRDPGRRLRIGYVSGDLRKHAVAFFFEPVLACHDRARVEVFCYSSHPFNAADAVTAKLMALADHWRQCDALSDEALAEQIRADGIHILVDLSGHTGFNRLLAFARKPAPVQATWLGYPGTTGLRAIDYRLTDALLDPPGQAEAQYTEALVRLPHVTAFRPAPESPPVNTLPALASGQLTLACLNALVKINAQVVALWARILRELPGARLLFGNVTEAGAAARLSGLFAQAGIGPERLLFRPHLPLAGYLALHHEIDLALDPFPYSGGTTTNHSLWMGVPVVTLAGPTSASRQGAALLGGAGLHEFITHSADDYVARVLDLVSDLPRLNAIRQGLRARSGEGSGAGAEAMTRGLEQAYRTMWERYCAS